MGRCRTALHVIHVTCRPAVIGALLDLMQINREEMPGRSHVEHHKQTAEFNSEGKG